MKTVTKREKKGWFKKATAVPRNARRRLLLPLFSSMCRLQESVWHLKITHRCGGCSIRSG